MRNLIIILISLIPFYSNCQDTVIVVGKNPKYINLYKGSIDNGLHYKLPKGTYYYYTLKSKYKNKIPLNDKQIKDKKYRGSLIQITTYGEDSLKAGISKSFRYDYKTKKDICYGFINYSNGIKEGLSVEYNNNGTIISVGNYKNGKEHGSWFFFGNNPTEVTEIKYDNGKMITTD